MEKALAARSDPYLALLEHRNTPSDGMTSSPAQRLFARRTRTRLPTSSRLLEPACAKSVKQELQKAKSKQADYYNKGTKQLPVLKRGDVVRIMPKEGEKTWKLGKVKAVVSPRSYIVTTLDGVNYRRNRRHLRKTAEPEEEETNVDTPPRGNEQQDQHPVLAPEQQDVPRHENNTAPSTASGPPTSRTASGRQTRRPAYLDDYVTET